MMKENNNTNISPLQVQGAVQGSDASFEIMVHFSRSGLNGLTFNHSWQEWV